MGASFRNTGEIKELAGCDRLTISPALLEELNSGYTEIERKLDAKKSKELEIEELGINESIFRYEMNKDKMANDLLADGIRRFDEDG
jgi:transaldolase